MFLAQTGQLYLESACMALGKVYCFGPTFRAEKSKSRRHLTEFWMVEPEVAWCDLDGILAIAEDFVCSLAARVLQGLPPGVGLSQREHCRAGSGAEAVLSRHLYAKRRNWCADLQAKELLDRDLATKTRPDRGAGEARSSTPRSSRRPGQKWQQDKAAHELAELRDELADLKVEVGNIPHHMQLAAGFEWGKDLGGSDETIISRLHDRPVFVTHYPRDAKAFYMKKNAAGSAAW